MLLYLFEFKKKERVLILTKDADYNQLSFYTCHYNITNFFI